jgi:peroxiredoxin
MAQLRHDYEKFKQHNTEVLVMVPNGPKTIASYRKHVGAAYPILTDKGAKAAAQYLQVKHFFAFGTPTVFLVDRKGIIRYAHYASSLIAEPDNREPLAALAQGL